MPFVKIEVVGDLSADQKRNIATDISNSLQIHAGKPAASTYVAFSEHSNQNFAKGDQLVEDIQNKAKKQG